MPYRRRLAATDGRHVCGVHVPCIALRDARGVTGAPGTLAGACMSPTADSRLRDLMLPSRIVGKHHPDFPWGEDLACAAKRDGTGSNPHGVE